MKISINDASNGGWLNEAAQKATRPHAYGEWVAGRLRGANTKDNVMDALGQIKATLQNLNADPTNAPWPK